MYVSAGLCAATNEAVLCIGLWGDLALNCVTATAVGSRRNTAFTGSTVYSGDPDHLSIYGLKRNVRLYSGALFDFAQANSQYTYVKDYCMAGARTVYHLIYVICVTTATIQTHLKSASDVIAAAMAVLMVDIAVTLPVLVFVVSFQPNFALVIGCHKLCLTCHGPRVWESNGCQSGLYKQPPQDCISPPVPMSLSPTQVSAKTLPVSLFLSL
jgi:hypothetical protein